MFVNSWEGIEFPNVNSISIVVSGEKKFTKIFPLLFNVLPCKVFCTFCFRQMQSSALAGHATFEIEFHLASFNEGKILSSYVKVKKDL